MQRRHLIMLALIVLMFVSGCVERTQRVTGAGDSYPEATARVCFAKTSEVQALVDSAICVISAIDMDTIRQELQVTETTVQGTINDIPAGVDRLFEVSTYDSTGTLTYYGSAVADVLAGQIISLNLVLYPATDVGTAIIVGTFAPYPQGDKIVFRSKEGYYHDILIADPYTYQYQNLTNTPNNDEHCPRISWDGQKIAFSRVIDGTWRPFTMNLDGSNQSEMNFAPGESIAFEDWAPNGEEVLLKSHDERQFIYNFVTDVSSEIPLNGHSCYYPQFSPDGEWITYLSDWQYNPHIRLMRVDGSENQIVPGTEYMDCKCPCFSPDGQTILFYGRQVSGTWDLYKININGSNLTQLTNTPEVDEVQNSWSPDGNKIVYAKGYGAGLDLYIMNADGSQSELFLALPDQQFYPHWR